MPGKRFRPEDLAPRPGRRPFSACVFMDREELEAFNLCAAIHGYQAIAPFLRRLLNDACDAHGIATGSEDDYPLPGALRVTRELALERAVVAGTYTPPPAWWLEYEEDALTQKRRVRQKQRRDDLARRKALRRAAQGDASRGPRGRSEAAE